MYYRKIPDNNFAFFSVCKNIAHHHFGFSSLTTDKSQAIKIDNLLSSLYKDYKKLRYNSTKASTCSHYRLYNTKTKKYKSKDTTCFEAFVICYKSYHVNHKTFANRIEYKVSTVYLEDKQISDYVKFCIDSNLLPSYIDIDKLLKEKSKSGNINFVLRLDSRNLSLELFYLYICNLRNICGHPNYVRAILFMIDKGFRDNIVIYYFAFLLYSYSNLGYFALPYPIKEEDFTRKCIQLYKLIHTKVKRSQNLKHRLNRWWKFSIRMKKFIIPESIIDKYDLTNINNLNIKEELENYEKAKSV